MVAAMVASMVKSALPGGLRRNMRRVAAKTGLWTPPPPPGFGLDDIERVAATYFAADPAANPAWEPLRDAHLRLPAWFRTGLDPLSAEYAAQQHRLWQEVAGVDGPYDPQVHEKEHDWSGTDPVRAPGFYRRRDAAAVAHASDHVLASGMLLKHAGVKAGDRALEYGAGFGQTALALARLGVHVDTVDISPTFCEFVRSQAEFFRVPLTAFQGQFGANPRPGQTYKLIWFYESFHHCLDFERLIRTLPGLLQEGGHVILGGEPVVERENAAVPYPWGLRLHSEVVAVVRRHHWFELGFSERFLFERFAAAGFAGRRIDCEPSLFGRLYVFEPSAGSRRLGVAVATAQHGEQLSPRGPELGRPRPAAARAPMSALQRTLMTISCRDSDAIPKAPTAGSIVQRGNDRVQVMHNGVEVLHGAYHGDWMAHIIRGLRGHHEPQKELIFHAVLRAVRNGSQMVELGSFWAYYTQWYLKEVPDSTALCIEPDPAHLHIGIRNGWLNGHGDRLRFINAWIGGEASAAHTAGIESGDGQAYTAPMLDAAAVAAEAGGPIELLQLDIQGAELPFLRSITPALAASGALRFVMVSTHHSSISGSATLHQDCIATLRAVGATILVEHDVVESYSGDGLVLASFLADDGDLRLPSISRNRPGTSLFATA